MEGTIGEIRGFGGNFAPRNWALCQGQLIAISQNQALFSILGTTFGGDGRTTFGLPDLRGRVPIGTGTGPGLSPRPLGQRSGVDVVTLTQSQIPAHTHTAALSGVAARTTIEVSTDDGIETEASGHYLATSVTGTSVESKVYNTTGEAGEHLGGVTSKVNGGTGIIGYSGGSQYHNNLQPYLTIYWVICMFGVYPSRN